MGRIVMKPFNLDEYLKNPNKKVITRDGKNVKIHCTNCVGAHPVIAEIEGEKYSYFYDKNGEYYFRPSISDLFFASEKKIGWVNLYKDESNHYLTGRSIYDNEADAVTYGSGFSNYIKTIKLEWEE